MKTSGHPWDDFLFHRARAMRWLRDELGRTTEEIVQTMGMIPAQVESILRHVDKNPKEYGFDE